MATKTTQRSILRLGTFWLGGDHLPGNPGNPGPLLPCGCPAGTTDHRPGASGVGSTLFGIDLYPEFRYSWKLVTASVSEKTGLSSRALAKCRLLGCYERCSIGGKQGLYRKYGIGNVMVCTWQIWLKRNGGSATAVFMPSGYQPHGPTEV